MDFSQIKAVVADMDGVLWRQDLALPGFLEFFELMQQRNLPYVLAVAASSFIYIAVADLIPTLHERVEARATLQQILLIASGIVVIYLTHSSLH